MQKIDERDSKGGLRYELPAAALPHDGIYSLQAFLSGLGKNKKPVKSASRIVKYK